MNYVDHLNLFGVEAKEVPCIKGSGAPTEATVGAVGMLYMDTDTGDIYKCTAVVDGDYTWSIMGGGSSASAGHLAKNITLPASGWVDNEQTVTVNGVLADAELCTVIAGPDWSSADVCNDCEVNCIAQGNNSLSFQCTYIPNEDVVINVTVLT